MSSLMVAGLASGFKSQVANLLWMKSDEYWHKGLLTRQNPLMELVVTLDPQFIEAWSTAGWHWAYNIYADIDSKYKNNPKMIRQKQDMAIETGLNYLGRGAEMNPETYRLWFEHGWTREKKAGLVDDKTVQLYSEARKQRDARTIYRDVPDKSGKTRQVGEEGIDIIGRTIAHLYESRPDLDKAQDHYALDLLKATPEERAGLDAVGRYLGQYGWGYQDIVNEYQKGDATMKEQIKRIVPDVEKMAAAHQVRLKMQTRNDQPTGAYITIEARYMPAWRQMKAGDIQGAINRLIGVMNADPRYHLQGLPRLAKVLELRGDAPVAIKGQFDQARKGEISSSQDIALRMLATLYERAVAAQKDPAKQKPLLKLAYETWYRARERNSLDFHARRQTLNYEDKYNFTTPKHIVDEIKKSRRGGEPNAAPEAPPNVQQYYQAPPAGGEHHEGEHHEGDGHNH
jgi:tetratricopeptide (TPR) repeat protein